MQTVIQVENVSKQYRLGKVGSGTLRDDLTVFWAGLRGKENPFLKVGEENRRDEKGNSDYVWALRDIDFAVKEGDVLGVIGKNGAGKSTLLKILSRVTTPTTGSIKVKGRIASLLEVGTGFHPDLTGRENMFLNGAILGMTQNDVKLKFDEIVAFSGVEKYIDTPVKRYSSGMYVRLAFAVAAHLEPEILIIDEVLAVGDADFQKKCLGKMKDVSGQGRTVIFVSHNMGAVKSLCKTGLVMQHGRVIANTDINSAINVYTGSHIQSDETPYSITRDKDPKKVCQIISAEILNPKESFDVFDDIYVKFTVVVNEKVTGTSPMINIKDSTQDIVKSFTSDQHTELLDEWLPGTYTFITKLPSILKKGLYSIDLEIGKLMVSPYDALNEAFTINIDELSFNPSMKSFASYREGLVTARFDWEINKH